MNKTRYKTNYIVHDNGEVFKITKNGLKKKKFSSTCGYLQTSINGRRELVHRIVMSAFKGESELTVDHLNGIKTDNRLENLEYVTLSENVKRQHRDGRNTGIHAMHENQKKKVLWNGTIYDSATELSYYLGLKRNACCESIRVGRKLKGHYAKYI
ncbi:HNH endonuclease [Lactococcus phage 38507]|jgi:hypothetical protein|uniref:HNH endonuclease n=1 Tax=Lactococcus phage 38507 TaxID=2029663 RepID=A0A343JPB1_9CAUD|nr:HNH endonuclease [Lactococcus phage 38507]ASZ71334.1 HNH endonuclease [Lactococcus phage 38507]